MTMIVTEKDQARFYAKLALPNKQGCMLWLAYVDPAGYGRFGLDRQVAYAHRVSYVLAYGPTPQGLHIDHLCRVRACARPGHLELVTPGENARRGETGANMRAKTHCPQRHPYDETNTYVDTRGGRICRVCRLAGDRRRRDKAGA